MPSADTKTRAPERLRIRIAGAVQGVGFRPFVHRLATRYGLAGFVLNDGAGVLLEVEGQGLDSFVAALRHDRPSLARIDAFDVQAQPARGAGGFEIRPSRNGAACTRIVADAATCDACLAELFDPASRFHLYPFVTCTNCGPRVTITRRLPFDRANTAMADFPLCPACAHEYADPASRRFHAESFACPACGPRLSHPVSDIAGVIRAGGIVAVKGIGGFHLLCDAESQTAVAELRRRKAREAKPFAIMVADETSLDRFAEADDAERALLCHRARPIVLLRARAALAPSVAPGLAHVGVMLPYAPVHHLIFDALARTRPVALVATSANRHGEPLVIDDAEATARLAGIADLIVTHDRPILARADDSVMTMIDGAPAYIRRSRGFVPDPVDLGIDGPCVLAVGAQQKASVTVTRGREAFVSAHVGDLDSAAMIRFHEETIRHLLRLLDVAPEAVACDLHPDFHATRLAAASGLPVIGVQHHVAHIAAIAAEHRISGPLLGIAADGYGYGTDGAAWVGELLLVDGAGWQRLGHLLPLPLPGGDRAAREPWRMGVAALTVLDRGGQAGHLFPEIPLAPRLATVPAGATTTSLGRLFDAASALLGLRTHQSYEGQAAVELEALVREPRALPHGYAMSDGRLDFRPLLAALPALRDAPAHGANLFHGTLIEGFAAWAGTATAQRGLTQVALSGGCFVNRVLADGICTALRARGLTPLLPRAVPANDAGLSLGQVHVARATLAATVTDGKEEACASQFRFA
jgi:hydrogenase maturation protein HypF